MSAGCLSLGGARRRLFWLYEIQRIVSSFSMDSWTWDSLERFSLANTGIAQLVEQLICNQHVRSSSLLAGFSYHFADIANQALTMKIQNRALASIDSIFAAFLGSRIGIAYRKVR